MTFSLTKLFESDESLNRLVSGLPRAFEIVKQEMPPGNPAVGVLREHVIIGFFVTEYGTENVAVPEKRIERGYDVKLFGTKLSIKTVTGNALPKVLWTVDPLQIGKEISRDYKPTCDMFVVNIYWNKHRHSIFFIPVEVQQNVWSVMKDQYLDAKIGTNHRGISISRTAMTELKDHEKTLTAKVNWVESGIEISPHARWKTYWNVTS